MTQRHVDVLAKDGAVLHTYPITLGGIDAAHKDADYETAALKQAATAKLVPEADLSHLTARVQPHAPATDAAASAPQAKL